MKERKNFKAICPTTNLNEFIGFAVNRNYTFAVELSA